MNILTLKRRVFTPNLLSFLSKRGLIRSLVPTKNVLRCCSGKGTVGTIYSSGVQHGTHKLISVRCTNGPIRLNSHADNEEFILIHPNARAFNPLYMIIGLHKHEVILRKAKNQALTCDDFMAIELKYNHPSLSIFTMLKDTVHFEIAARGRRESAIFFVTEPSRLKLRMLNLPGYRLELQDKKV